MGRRAAGTWVALALLSALLLAGLYLFAVHTEVGQRLDERSFGRLDPAENPDTFDATEDFLETISVASVALLGGAIVALATLRRRWDLAAAAAAAMLGANLTTQALKAELPRPDLVASQVGEASLPSGHATVAVSLALALVLVVPPTGRLLAGVVGGAYAIAIGVATIAADWHRPSDVAAAYLVAALWTALAGAVLATRRRRAPEPGREGVARRARRAGRAAAGLAAAFVLTVAVAAVLRVGVLRLVDDRTAFLAAAAAVALLGAAVVATITGLLARSEPGAPDA